MYSEVCSLISKIAGYDLEFDKITFDSRKSDSRSIFFAVQGVKRDGREFALDVLNQGGYVLTDSINAPESFTKLIGRNPKLIIVNNIYNTIIEVASKLRDKIPLVISVTGSSGKTTTKNALYTVVSDNLGITLSSPGNYNTEYGLLLSLINLTDRTRNAILELGISKPGDMDILASISRPDLVIILPIEYAHVVEFNNREHLIKEKLKVLQHTSKLAVIHNSLRDFIPECNCEIRFYDDENIHFSCDKNNFNLSGQITCNGESYPISNTDLHGEHILQNMCGIVALLKDIIPVRDIITSLSRVQPIPGRNAIYNLKHNGLAFKLYDSAYNANAGLQGSMRKELELMAKNKTELILILGGIMGLNDDLGLYHSEILDYAKQLTSKIITIGNKWPHDDTILQYKETDSGVIINRIIEFLTENCMIFMKGSNAFGLTTVVQELVELCNGV